MTTKPSHRLTLKDRLSQLSFTRVCQLLGPEGKQLLQQGAKFDEIRIDRDDYLSGDPFRLNLSNGYGPAAIVTITLMAESQDRLKFNGRDAAERCPAGDRADGRQSRAAGRGGR